MAGEAGKDTSGQRKAKDAPLTPQEELAQAWADYNAMVASLPPWKRRFLKVLRVYTAIMKIVMIGIILLLSVPFFYVCYVLLSAIVYGFTH